MTPEEKAKEIYQSIVKELVKNKYKINVFEIKNLAKETSKIHVNGIIEANPIIPLSYMLESESLDAAREFWNEVLKEIDNL